MSRLKTMAEHLHNDEGMSRQPHRINICMAAYVYGRDSSTCMVGGMVDPPNCIDCPSDSLENFNKVMACLDIKP